jgi:hypothetical protein
VSVSESGPLVRLSQDPLADARWEGNVIWGADAVGDVPVGGYRRIDPQLTLRNGLYRPSSSSPLVDAAVDVAVEADVDMDGQPRDAAKKDVGADEVSDAPVVRRPLTRADVGPDAADE